MLHGSAADRSNSVCIINVIKIQNLNTVPRGDISCKSSASHWSAFVNIFHQLMILDLPSGVMHSCAWVLSALICLYWNRFFVRCTSPSPLKPVHHLPRKQFNLRARSERRPTTRTKRRRGRNHLWQSLTSLLFRASNGPPHRHSQVRAPVVTPNPQSKPGLLYPKTSSRACR